MVFGVRCRLMVLVPVVLVCGLVFGAVSADATLDYKAYENVCPKLGEPALCTGIEGMDEPMGIAVDNSASASDPAKGDVYVANQASSIVSRFTAGGEPAPFTGTNANIVKNGAADTNQLSLGVAQAIRGVAVESATGDFYVSDEVSSKVEGFSPAGEPVAEFAIPAGIGVLGIAVDNSTSASDPSKGDIYVAGFNTGTVYKYEKGVQVGEITGNREISPGVTEGHPLAVPFTLAVDASGGLYVVNSGSNDVEKFNTKGEWEKGSATSENLAEGIAANGVSVDPATGDVLVQSNDGYVQPYTESGTPLPPFGTGEEDGTSFGIAANAADDAVYVSYIGFNNVFVYQAGEETAPPSDLEAEPVTGLTAVSVQLNARFNPGNYSKYSFEYCPSKDACLKTTESVLRGETQQPVTAEVTSLIPATNYTYKFTASNKLGTIETTGAFTTEVALPQPRTDPANTVTSTSAELDGEVNPGGAETTYYFEYGQEPCAENTCTKTPEGTPVTGTGLAQRIVEASEVTSLTPGTRYYYELVATNPKGAVHGTEKEFTTQGEAPKKTEGPRPGPTPNPVLTPTLTTPTITTITSKKTTTTLTKKTTTPKTLTRAQKLTKALKACKKESKKKRSMCVRHARKEYGQSKQKK